MIIIGFFICIWYLTGGIALYYKIFTNGVEYFGYPWTVLILGLTKLYTDEIFFWPKIHRKYTKLVLHLSSIMLLFIFLYISFRIIKNCFNQDNEFLKISLSGLATLLIFQTFIHE